MNHLDYLKYILKHKWYVFVECCKLAKRFLIPELVIIGIFHDCSKFLPSEWLPYVRSFYGGCEWDERPAWLKKDFDYAWNHHQKRNKHHWQYWLLTNDSDEPQTKALEMPELYVLEMVADWIGAGKAITGKDNTKQWYNEHKDRIFLHEWTRVYVEVTLGI